MKKLIFVALVALAIIFSAVAPSHARGHGGHGSSGGHPGGHFEGHRGGHGRVFIDVGPSFYWGPYWDPYWYYPPAYAYAPTPDVVQEPPVYTQQQPAQLYWYYCPSAKAYYPTVQNCPEPWLRVAPRTE
jgi:hypothetical protein